MANQVFLSVNVDTKQPVASFAELKQTAKELQKQLSELKPDSKGFDVLKEKVILAKSEIQNFNNELRVTPTITDRITDAFGKIGGVVAGAFAVDKILQFGEASFKAFEKSELAAKLLQTQVGVNGGLQKDFVNLINQAKELSTKTIFSHSQIEAAQTYGLQFGLTAKQVQNLIPTIADFASATQQDLKSAFEAVLKGSEGSGKALKQYQISLKDGATQSQQLTNIIDQLNNKFSGQAEIVGNTTFGSIEKLKNKYDDFKEGIGETITSVGEATASMILWVANGFKPVEEEAENTTNKLKLTQKEIKTMQAQFDAFTLANLQGQLETLNKLGDNVGIQKVTQQLKDFNLRKFNDEINLLDTDKLVAKLKQVQKASDDLKSGKSFQLAKPGDVGNDEQLKLINEEIAARKKEAELIAEQNKTPKGVLSKQQEAQKKLHELSIKDLQADEIANEENNRKELLALQTNEENKLRIIEESEIKIRQIKEKYALADLQKTATDAGVKFDKSGDLSKNQTNLQAVKDFQNARKEIIDSTNKEIENITIDSNQKVLDEERNQNKKNAEEDYQDNVKNIERAGAQQADQITANAKDKTGNVKGDKVGQDQLNINLLQNEINTNQLIIANVNQTDAQRSASEQKVFDLKKKLSEAEKNLSFDTQKQKQANELLYAGAAVQIVEQVMNASIQASARAAQAQIDSINKSTSAAIEALNIQESKENGTYRAKTAIQKKFDAERKAVEAQAQAEEKAIKTEQFKKEKEANIISAIMNTALAVIKAAPVIPLEIITAALGAVQIGIIASQPTPTFASGGILQGSSHANGGIKTPFGELEGGEIVLNKNVSRNSSLTSMASQINAMAGGRAFATGGILPSYIPSSQNINVNNQLNFDTLKDFLNQKLNQPSRSYVVESDISNSQSASRIIERRSKLFPTDDHPVAPVSYLSQS